MSRSCFLYDWCFPLHGKEGANSPAEEGEGGLKYDAHSGSGGSVPGSYHRAFDDAGHRESGGSGLVGMRGWGHKGLEARTLYF